MRCEVDEPMSMPTVTIWTLCLRQSSWRAANSSALRSSNRCSPNSSCQCGAPPSCECRPANPLWPCTPSWLSWVMPSILLLRCASVRLSVGVSLIRIVAVAPGHVQVTVDAADQRQVHLFPEDVDGAEAGLAEPAK